MNLRAVRLGIGVLVVALVASGCMLLGPKVGDLTGTVTYVDDSTPVVGAEVQVGSKSSTTDAQGRFSLKGINYGEYELRIYVDGELVRTQRVRIASRAQNVQIAVERVTRYGSVQGVIQNAQKEPIADARIILLGTEKVTGADGSFFFEDVVYGEHAVTVVVDGNEYSFIIVVNAPEIADVVLEIPESILYGVVSGSVVFASGGPAPDVLVEIAGKTARTDASGNFAIEDVQYGDYFITAYFSSLEFKEWVTVDQPEVTSIEIVVPALENIALNKPVTASSVFSDKYIPEHAVDGIYDTRDSRWLTASDAQPPHWLEIDLEGMFGLDHAVVYTGDMGSGGNPGYVVPDFKLQYWTGDEWVDIPGASVQGTTEGQLQLTFTAPVVTTKVRFYTEHPGITADGVTVHRIREIMVFGVPAHGSVL